MLQKRLGLGEEVRRRLVSRSSSIFAPPQLPLVPRGRLNMNTSKICFEVLAFHNKIQRILWSSILIDS